MAKFKETIDLFAHYNLISKNLKKIKVMMFKKENVLMKHAYVTKSSCTEFGNGWERVVADLLVQSIEFGNF